MMDSQKFKRFPAVQCWIKHILEAAYLGDQNAFFSIFGKIKRVRLIATILDKRELIHEPRQDGDLDSSDNINTGDGSSNRMEFDLDDTTGQIRAVIFGIDPDDYSQYEIGDIVDIVGLLRRWKSYTSITPEILKKVEDPNLILLRNAEIIKRLKFGELHEIPEIQKDLDNIDEISEEINYDSLFENDDEAQQDIVKKRIHFLIRDYSKEGIGISLQELKTKTQLTIEDLKKYLNDLIMESKIYQSDENIYESFD
ncbi:MAG: hypothetical protein EU533_06420 [Promethearchaeota archaeon]|nr:MAG: hypothetical protein EU533_06420 [Candidatus Lokiarchaeota archaeon]